MGGNANNGVLAGLVAITAPCSTCEPYAAFIIGFLAAFVYIGCCKTLDALKIDDVVGAIPVHGACGFFGVIMAAFFATQDNYGNAYYGDRAEKCAGLFYGGDGSSFAAAIVLLLVEASVEAAGMDSSEHGVTTGYAAAKTAEMT